MKKTPLYVTIVFKIPVMFKFRFLGFLRVKKKQFLLKHLQTEPIQTKGKVIIKMSLFKCKNSVQNKTIYNVQVYRKKLQLLNINK